MFIQGIIRAIVKQERQGHDDLSNTKINCFYLKTAQLHDMKASSE